MFFFRQGATGSGLSKKTAQFLAARTGEGKFISAVKIRQSLVGAPQSLKRHSDSVGGVGMVRDRLIDVTEVGQRLLGVSAKDFLRRLSVRIIETKP